ncbi:hypothetical protein CYV26_06490 [Carnobacterium maltaromaticum]|uniref:hypothetical protein n=1 Tax=Carnobacterium maltaromaticum TaxID=2751 RepID=UPI000C75FC24|nr:hypothetical protein [Carnobacterium maltaromaticum]PLS38353.1 hypothetical protein CYV33_03955 [Carnobacterium maltaromaticum]PLS38730.1 hypothetical protein CYV31_06480 [Carnobacterium maltaromaticum]PLS39107.1 hypothetical protein CYV30_03950 [Carnobacterium maltaromaticum]PLS45377.1 hypothetical protein CYV28_03950 [Carnobacterium maltaromaticum]PLS48233.1 hypothetical protein CYV27_01990 [Carnobacterium maltaromaticum]
MKTYQCSECGESFSKKELDSELFKESEYFCISCTREFAEAAWDYVDPDHNFESFEDWDEKGH